MSRPYFNERIRPAFRLGSRVARLSPSEFFLLLRAFVALCVAACTVHLLPYKVLLKRMDDINQFSSFRPSKRVPVEQLAVAVNRASRLLPGATCLTRAIAGCRLMMREGYPVRIQFGVARPVPEDFGAHCWVEIDGIPVIGSADGYEVLRAGAADH